MRLLLVYSFLSMFCVTSFADVSKDLFSGIESNDLTTVEKAIKAGADVNKPEKNKFTPLGWAASKGNLAIMNLLINAGANINSVAGPFGASALTYDAGGSGSDNPDAVKLLLQHGAKVNFKDRMSLPR